MSRRRLTPAEVRREALVRAGLRAPNQREFDLNSAEAYEALCPRDSEPWIRNGSLPREPRAWPRMVERDR